MTWTRPTLEALIEQTSVELATRLGLGPLQRRSVLGVLGRVAAGLAHSAHGHLEFIADQILPTTATGAYLEQHASLRGLARKAATFASGTVTFTGLDGSVVPSGARLQRVDGVEYEVTAATTLGSLGTGTAPVEALLPGAAGNASGGASMTLQTSAAGVQPTATVVELTGGEDQETDEQLRERILAVWRARPEAGTEADYIAWSLEVPGITRAWAYGRTPQLGSVTLYVVADSNTPTIAPTSAQLAAVQDLVNLRRPITARVLVQAPTLAPVALSIRVSPDTPAVRAAVTASLSDAIARDAAPGGTIRRSRLAQAIADAPGEEWHELTLPSGDVVAAPGTLSTLGAITWL
jgi:uncharacterized phage protein gp47/JayE